MSAYPSPPAIPSRTLGTDGPLVSAVGLGCVGMSDFYGPANEAASLATIHAALSVLVENMRRNQDLINALGAIASRINCTLPQLALAWVFSRGTDIIPLIGARTTERLTEALGGTMVHLSVDDLAEVDRVAPRGALAGERYPEEQMAWLDSERT